MLPEYLRLWGLLVIALCFWLIPACYPLKKHEQGISLGISLTATLALLHYSKRQIQEEILEQNYQLMEEELVRSELAYQTYQKEQEIQNQYLSGSMWVEVPPVHNAGYLPQAVTQRTTSRHHSDHITPSQGITSHHSDHITSHHSPQCPKCGSGQTVKNGSIKSKNGSRIPRFYCRDCEKTFKIL